MDILMGTTNLSKLKRFRDVLGAYNVKLLLPAELGIHDEPEENGSTPLENAKIKAAFYGRYFDPVICCDNGMHILELSDDDPRQPGLHVRAPQGIRLDDEQMIEYYGALARSLGGRMTCCYPDGVAVYRGGVVTGYADIGGAKATHAFYMVDTPHPKRHPGLPLDSLSIHIRTGRYYMDEETSERQENKLLLKDYHRKLAAFLADALGL